ncbi:MAG: GNAT family N-acetyltransferase [Duncaniella sp.]|nr:GNAT family N-acetyltransferase [Duncaniella sp.]
MIEIYPVDSASVPAGMEALYMESFPAEERRPWTQILHIADTDPRFAFNIISYDGVPVGFITIWNLGCARYVEHFAITPGIRGRGIGHEVISRVVANPGPPVVLEVEPASSGDIARRRINFYTRAGLTAHHSFNYIQPPYSDGLPAVALTLMTSAHLNNLKEVSTLLHKEIYGVK